MEHNFPLFFMSAPAKRLVELLAWADCPVSFVVENHHESLSRWISDVRKGSLCEPQYILHVDEHHDTKNESTASNMANLARDSGALVS